MGIDPENWYMQLLGPLGVSSWATYIFLAVFLILVLLGCFLPPFILLVSGRHVQFLSCVNTRESMQKCVISCYCLLSGYHNTAVLVV